MWVDPERLVNATSVCSAKIVECKNHLNSLIPTGWCERNLGKKQLKGRVQLEQYQTTWSAILPGRMDSIFLYSLELIPVLQVLPRR